MAIGTDDSIHKFGTQDEVTNGTTPGTIADGAFSVAGDVADWTNDDDAEQAMFVLEIDDLSGAPSAGRTVGLYCKPLNVRSTNDHEGPNTNLDSIYLGAFLMEAEDPAGTTVALVAGPFDLPNVYTSQVYEFYLKNNLGVTIGATTSDWRLYVTPISSGPHP